MHKAWNIAVCALGALTSCGTIINGPTQPILITSTPAHGAVTLDGQFCGYTPTQAVLSRRDVHTIRIEVPGFRPYEARFVPRISGWAFGNLVFFGVPGIAVDAITGGLYKLKPNELHAHLLGEERALATLSGDEEGSSLMTLVSSVGSDWEQIGQLERDDG